MIDTDMVEQILQGDDTHPDILQALGLELLAEVKRLQKEVRKQSNIVGRINDLVYEGAHKLTWDEFNEILESEEK